MYCVLGHTEPSVSALDQGAENGTSFSVVVVVVRRESASLTVSGVRSKSKTPLHVLQICSLIPCALKIVLIFAPLRCALVCRLFVPI